jgi:Ca-activated chloride channel homolog
MKRLINLLILLSVSALLTYGQEERKLVREGVKEYRKDNYTGAEVKYRKALDARPGLYEAEYDIANSLYKQNKFKEAAAEYDKLLQDNKNPSQRADLYHNLGNSFLNTQEYDKSVEAYKNSLRIRPDDEDTRYNLAYALQKIKEQQQQKQNQDQNNKDQDKNKQDQDKDRQKQDQQEQKNKEQQQQQQQQKEQQQPKDQKEGQQAEKKPDLSKQEMEQMLNAVQNSEKDVKEKLDKKKAVAKPARTDKDW